MFANDITNKREAAIDVLNIDYMHASANVLIAGGWLWLHWSILIWLGRTLLRQDNRLNLALLVVAAVTLGTVAVRRLAQGDVRLSVEPVATWPTLILTFAAAIAYVVIEYYWGVRILSAVLFGLGTYGLISVFYPNRSLPVALLLIAVLPFGSYLDVYVGFPIRMLTARAIEQLLASLHIASASAETILRLEGGIAHIDLPCSGVQSLWTGLLFFLAATCAQRPALGWRWIASGAVIALALLTANATRVAILIILALVVNVPRIAEMLHVPLGVLGFLGCCALTLVLLSQQGSPTADATHSGRTIAPARVHMSLLATIAVLGLLYRPAPLAVAHLAPTRIVLPPSIASEVEPLTDEEIDFFERHGPVQAERRRVRWHDHTASVLLAFSPTWRGHHNPEHCLAGNGMKIGPQRTLLARPAFPVRTIALEDGTRTAIYWFQSPTRTTDEIASRIWADFTGAERRWVLVSIVFDAAADPSAARTHELLELVHAAVDTALKGAPT